MSKTKKSHKEVDLPKLALVSQSLDASTKLGTHARV